MKTAPRLDEPDDQGCGVLSESVVLHGSGCELSLLLILLTVVLVVAVYARMHVRARSAIRSWAAEYGYRVVSCRSEAMFSSSFRQDGQAAEVVYRVVLDSASSDRLTGYFLIWNLLYGRPTVVVQWVAPPGAHEGG